MKEPKNKNTILLCGFEGFGEIKRNPSGEAVRRIMEEEPKNSVITGKVLPVIFGKAFLELKETIDRLSPDFITLTGVSLRTAGFRLERTALNIADSKIKDNAGAQPRDQLIEKDGPPAYFTTLPLDRIKQNLEAAGLPVSLSYYAGTYVCNDLLYRTLHYCEKTEGKIKTGFVHIPPMLEQTPELNFEYPRLPLTTICQGLRIVVNSLLYEI